MKHLSIFILFIISFSYAFTQSFEWVAIDNIDYEANPNLIQYATASDGENNAYLFGTKEHIEFYSISYGEQLLQKYSDSGELSWSKVIGGLSAAAGIKVFDSQAVYIIGSMRSELDFWGEGSLNYAGDQTNSFIARIDQDGSFAWAINLTDHYPGSLKAEDLALDKLGNVYVGHSGWPNSTISRISPEGVLISDIDQSMVGVVSGIAVDNNENIIVAGACSGTQSLFGGVSHISPFPYSMYLVKYNSSGSPEWINFIEDVTCVYPSVEVDNEGYIYMSGPLDIPASFGSQQANGPSWVYDFYISRVSPTGTFEWVREVPQVQTGDALSGLLNHIDVTDEGHVIFGGFVRGTIDWENGFTTTANLYYDILLTEYNEAGEMLWVKTAGGDGYDAVHSVSVSPDGSVFLTGITGDTSNFDDIIHYSEELLYPYLAKLERDIFTGLDELSASARDIIIYPNPAQNKVFFTEDLHSINIYNAMGVLILEASSLNLRAIDITDIPDGYYIIHAFNTEGSPVQGKFIKR